MSDKPIPSEPKPAATILLLRDGDAGLEVFMVVRHHQIDFASGALVFPGGKADPQDFDNALIPFLRGANDHDDMRAAQVSAIREAFEECGILLAREAGSDDIISGERLATLQQFREPMNKGEISLLDFLQQQKLQDRIDELSIKIDADRLAQEVALLAQKADVREELDRLMIHVEQARALIDGPGPHGRRLDFLTFLQS